MTTVDIDLLHILSSVTRTEQKLNDMIEVMEDIRREVKKTNGRVTALEGKNLVREAYAATGSKVNFLMLGGFFSLITSVAVLVIKEMVF